MPAFAEILSSHQDSFKIKDLSTKGDLCNKNIYKRNILISKRKL